MSSACRSIRCRNTGSGYVKTNTEASAELDARLKALTEARQQQDNFYYPAATTAVVAAKPENAAAAKIETIAYK